MAKLVAFNTANKKTLTLVKHC